MRRRQGIAALMAGAVVVLALLVVFAIELSGNQSQSRHSLERTAHQRAQLVAGLMDAVFQQSALVPPQEAAMLGTPIVSGGELGRLRGTNDYAALVDASGRVIAHSGGFTAQARRAVLTGAALRLVRAGHPWGLGNIFPYGHQGVVDFARRVPTSQGARFLITGVPLPGLATFIESEMRRVPGVLSQHQIMVDGRGVVIASTYPARPSGYVFHTKAQLQSLHRDAGVVHGSAGKRYFDHVNLGDTTWTLLLTVPASQFFASVSGFRHWLPWAIFVAFGLVALAVLLLVRRAIRSGERIADANARLITSNAELGSARAELELSNAALEESNHALERFNEELERQARELVRSNTELDQFASIASHDLQEPLRKVRTFTERISETEAGNLSERGMDYLRRANASAERMQTLIEDLLRFSRVSTQVRPFSPVDLSVIIADVLDDLSEQVARDGAIVRVAPLPTISADGPQMRQLLQNLISNALKFRREGVTPELRVECDEAPGWLTMTVSDNGIGFDQQYARRIFRVFERLHGRGSYPGTGIGLALCRKIAERHGGTILATGVPDQGATFTVTLQTQRSEAVSDALTGDPHDSASPQRQEPYVTA